MDEQVLAKPSRFMGYTRLRETMRRDGNRLILGCITETFDGDARLISSVETENVVVDLDGMVYFGLGF